MHSTKFGNLLDQLLYIICTITMQITNGNIVFFFEGEIKKIKGKETMHVKRDSYDDLACFTFFLLFFFLGFFIEKQIVRSLLIRTDLKSYTKGSGPLASVSVSVCVCMCVCARVYVCMSVCISVRVYNICTYTR